ncbi:hypothetical protein F5Y14DRAFT_347130 [Nemania sp. NC0429]|nr:hypothetical protein F5Y14DRAFT_347130 [Nemania sp. NC0429]
MCAPRLRGRLRRIVRIAIVVVVVITRLIRVTQRPENHLKSTRDSPWGSCSVVAHPLQVNTRELLDPTSSRLPLIP